MAKREMMMLELDEKNHLYRFDGRPVLSNTGILRAEGFCDFSHVSPALLEAAIKRGNDVHRATHLFDLKLNWRKHCPDVEPQVEAWRQFRKDFRFTPRVRELMLFDPMHRIATKPDAWGDSDRGLITVQIKAGEVSRGYVEPQTAFEEHCLTEGWKTKELDSSANRWAVELKPDGKYTPMHLNDPTSLRVFFAAATVRMFKLKYKL